MPRSARQPCVAFLLVGFLAFSAGEVHAQAFSLERSDPVPGLSAGAAPVAETAQLPGSRFQPRLMVLGGVSGIGGDGIHPYGGLEGGLLYGRFGALVLGQYGDGNDFTSLLVAGGPAVQVTDLGFASFTFYGGMGFYQEKKVETFDRDMTVLYGGLSVRIPLGRVAAGLTVSLWQGELDGDEIVTPMTVRGHRFSVGLGL